MWYRYRKRRRLVVLVYRATLTPETNRLFRGGACRRRFHVLFDIYDRQTASCTTDGRTDVPRARRRRRSRCFLPVSVVAVAVGTVSDFYVPLDWKIYSELHYLLPPKIYFQRRNHQKQDIPNEGWKRMDWRQCRATASHVLLINFDTAILYTL